MTSKITLFTFEFPFGQQETFLENELKYLAKTFEQIQIVPLFGSNTVRNFNYPNVEVYSPVFKSKNDSLLSILLSKSFWKYLFVAIKEVGISKSKIIKSLKQAIIIEGLKRYLEVKDEIFKSNLWYFYWGTNSVNVLPFLESHPKTVARFHRFDLYDVDIDGGEIQIFREKLFSHLNLGILIAEDGVQYLKKKFDKLPKLIVSRLGVPDRGIAPVNFDNTFKIMTCSNIYLVKRVDLLAEALSKISEIKIHWTHFGDGPEHLKQKVLDHVGKFGNNITFDFRGRRPNEEVMNFFKNVPVDLFVNVSISEGLPVSIMEALSFGVPVMATSAGGVGELIGPHNGELLSLNLSTDELANNLKEFYKDKCGNQQIRENARDSWNKLVNADVNYTEFCQILKECNF